MIASRSAVARWPMTSESRCGRSFSSSVSGPDGFGLLFGIFGLIVRPAAQDGLADAHGSGLCWR